MKKIKKIAIIAFVINLILVSFSFGKTLSGKIFIIDEEGNTKPAVRASVFWLGTEIGTLTNERGEFQIQKHPKSHSLVIRYLGIAQDTVFVEHNQESIIVTLTPTVTTPEVEVTEQRSEIEISKSSPVKTEIITQEGLKKAACCNLSESFVTNPSVDVTFNDPLTGTKQIIILGLKGNYSQLTTNNVPNFRGIAQSFGLEYIPGVWMKNISISKGASSVTTGHESISSQINTEILEPTDLDKNLLNVFLNHHGRVELNSNIKLFETENGFSNAFLLHSSFYNRITDENDDLFADDQLFKRLIVFDYLTYKKPDVFESKTGLKVIFDSRRSGQSEFLKTNNSQDFWGSKISTERLELFTKNGILFEGDFFKSLGTIVALNLHRQSSFFGKRDYNAQQIDFYSNIILELKLFEDIIDGKVGTGYSYINANEDISNVRIKTLEAYPTAFAELNFHLLENLLLVLGNRVDFHNSYGLQYSPRIFIRYSPTDNATIRGSFGRGWKTAFPFAENTNVFATSKNFNQDYTSRMEDAWVAGFNFSYSFEILNRLITLNLEYFRIDFTKQLVVDYERSNEDIYFSNLNGKSFSNSFQIDFNTQLFKGFEITLAYRYNDVETTFGNELLQKPLVKKSKIFLNASYNVVFSESNAWKFDFTFDFNGQSRLPKTFQTSERSSFITPSFALLYAQITKIFGDYEIYIGGENLGNYFHNNQIINFKNPFQNNFDASMIWSPTYGRKLYLGARLKF